MMLAFPLKQIQQTSSRLSSCSFLYLQSSKSSRPHRSAQAAVPQASTSTSGCILSDGTALKSGCQLHPLLPIIPPHKKNVFYKPACSSVCLNTESSTLLQVSMETLNSSAARHLDPILLFLALEKYGSVY